MIHLQSTIEIASDDASLEDATPRRNVERIELDHAFGIVHCACSLSAQPCGPYSPN